MWERACRHAAGLDRRRDAGQPDGPGLAVGASATLTFSWTTTGARVGNHTLVATHSLTDANTANNQGSAVVAVTPKPIDIACGTSPDPPA